MVEYLERIGLAFQCDLWLVRTGGELGTARVYHDGDLEWQQTIFDQTQPWVGFAHPRVVPVHSTSWREGALVVVTGDERGPSILEAAASIDDPSLRAAWAVDQVAGIAEAIAMMSWRDPTFIHRRANYDQIIVGADGLARLRAMVAWVQWRALGTYLGRGNTFTRAIGYMAPEQVRSYSSSPATDVFALCATLYTALTGKRPFPGDGTDFGVLQAIVEAVPPPHPTNVPADVADLIRAGLARDPTSRPHNPATLAAELRRRTPQLSSGSLAAAIETVRARRGEARVAPSASHAIVGDRCHLRWEQLTPTGADGIRHCGQCKHDVVQVRSLDKVIPLLGRKCISYTPGDNEN